jgi:hypothetical protein
MSDRGRAPLSQDREGHGAGKCPERRGLPDGETQTGRVQRVPQSCVTLQLPQYVYLDNGREGRALVDPVFPEKEGRDLTLFRDAIGRPVMKEIIDKLRKDDKAWVQYLWPRPRAAATSRKLVYVKKVRVGEETFLVGSDFFLASPIWMKRLSGRCQNSTLPKSSICNTPMVSE